MDKLLTRQARQLQEAASKADFPRLKQLLTANGFTNQDVESAVQALSCSGSSQSADCLEALIRAGAEVKGQAVQHTMLTAATYGRRDLLERLVALNTELEGKDREGKTPLIRAAEQNHADCVRLLLGAGADVRARDSRGNTALHRAAECGCISSLRVLMDFGADVSSLNSDNKTPLQLAVAHKDCTALLIQQKEQVRPNTAHYKPSIKKKTQKKAQPRSYRRHTDDFPHPRDASQQAEDFKEQPSLLHLAPAPVVTKDQVLKALNSDLLRFTKELEEWQAASEPDYARAISTIESVVKELWTQAEVKIFGSYSTKLHLPSSDIDLVVLNADSQLADLQEALKTTPGVEQLRLISSAVIPVLKVTYRQDQLRLQLDVTLQDPRHRGLRACELVRRILNQCWLVKPVFMAFKQLFYWVDCHEAYKGGLSSYSLFLMCSSFLQRHRTTSLAETFLAALTYFASECDFTGPFLAYDPAQPEALVNLRAPQSLCLYVPDPLCPTSNVAHPTHLQSVIAIFRYAYGSLVRPTICECAKSPLWRMFQETKSQFQSL